MRELLLVLLKNATNVVGEAALEFMAALATGKLRIKEKDKEIVRAAVESAAMLSPVWKAFTEKPAF